MTAALHRTAIVYDFDGTLSPGSMQQHTLLPAMGYPDHAQFWSEVKALNKMVDGDEILTYMHCLQNLEGSHMSEQSLADHGARLPYFEGVDSWFDRIDEYGANRGLDIEHYIVSSGLDEIIAGTSIRKHFKHVFASKYLYKDGKPLWPAAAVNYTGKTQYLFRINKGVMNQWDDKAVNRWIPMSERQIPFERMIFIGDGDTDIPAMKMLRYQGGVPVAVFDPKRFQGPDHEKVYHLIAEDRADHVCPADYREQSQLDITVKGVLGRIARNTGYRPASY
jgi:2-hydroxy-3-keto-5-methylthiopentenyl-1-phosphate phosphatase